MIVGYSSYLAVARFSFDNDALSQLQVTELEQKPSLKHPWVSNEICKRSPEPKQQGMVYFRHFLLTVPGHSAFFDFFCVLFSHSKKIKFSCCLRGFRLRIALNLLKYVLIYLYGIYPVFLKYALACHFF